MKNVGLRPKKLRKERGVTLEDLSKIAKCHFFMLRDWEQGCRCLTIGVLIRLAQFFKVSVDYLVGLEPMRSKG